MSVAVVIGIGLLGGVGAIARFLLDGAVAGRAGRDLPWGTLAVNLTGSLLLGLLVEVTIGTDGFRLVATGLIGSYTTFSTWMLESHRLAEDGQRRLGVINLLISLGLGVAVAWLGREIGTLL